jgi:signal recognition particle subunit SRP54
MRKMFDALPLTKIPGASKIGDQDIETAQNKLQNYRYIMDSMTFRELEEPDIINSKRISRISKGSGRSEEEIRSLLREFKAMKKNVKAMKGNRGFKKLLKNQIRGGNFSLDNIPEFSENQ